MLYVLIIVPPNLFYQMPPSGITLIVHSLTGLQKNLFETCIPAFPSVHHPAWSGDLPTHPLDPVTEPDEYENR